MIIEQGEGWLCCILPQAREPGPVDVTIRVDDSTADHNGDAQAPRFTYQSDSYIHRKSPRHFFFVDYSR
jgi:hypothetical protein